jgi:rRNA-processing protein EBP2
MKGLSPAEAREVLSQKLASLREDLGDPGANFRASFTLTLPRHPAIESVDNDLLREQAFQDVALEGVESARPLLEELGIPYLRPPTMFAEMVKSDDQMDRIRRSLTEERQRKEQVIAKNKQRKATPDPAKQKRPGVDLRPKRSPRRDRERKKSK